ncbi:MAG: hypothetical protein H0U55_15080, partial [Rubrobacteraceae bacterium]|nr:hypothetical protein [Rubrobacteraceae bacterium]
MLSDLIQALPAALLVGVLPGWFWARCLLASGDYAERFVYAVALSVTLVPAAALAQTYLFGTGVTFAVTVASVALVFLTGLVAYLLLGRAKGPEGPIAHPPSPPKLPTLVPLVAALALALGMLLGAAPGGWLMIPIALLVLVAGFVYWRTLPEMDAPREASPAESPPETLFEEVPTAARYALLSGVLLLVLARGYLGPVVNGWPFPRGIDRYEHAVMAGMMMSRGSNESFMLYPPGFHLLTALI